MTEQYAKKSGDQGKQDHSRRRFIARGLELLSAVPLVGLLVSNSVKQNSYYEADLAPAMSDPTSPLAGNLRELQAQYTQKVRDVAQAHRDAYYRSHVETYPSMGADGNMTLETRVVYRWEEPSNIPNHAVIDRWRRNQIDLARKLSFVAGQPVLDIEKTRSIRLTEEQISRLDQTVFNTAIYGGEIALLLGYEEAIAAITYDGYEKKPLQEKVAMRSTEQQIGRRSLFKIAAALGGAFVAYQIGKGRGDQTKESGDRLETILDDAEQHTTRTPETSFERYFQVTPQQLISTVQSNVALANKTLQSGVDDKKVRASLQALAHNGNSYVAELQRTFSEGVPAELGKVAEGGALLNALTQTNSQNRSQATTSTLLEALAVGGTMAAILVPAELVNKKLP